MYVLDGSAALYNVKFYRGLREIYRFSPNESPPQKVLPFPGINIDVSRSVFRMKRSRWVQNFSTIPQTALSVGNKVVIKNIGFGLAGNYSCEVTSEGPPFSTATANTQLQVVGKHCRNIVCSFRYLSRNYFFIELPEAPPILFTEQTQYEPGDVLKANCTSPPSRPKVDLTITLNNIVVSAIYLKSYKLFFNHHQNATKNKLVLILLIVALKKLFRNEKHGNLVFCLCAENNYKHYIMSLLGWLGAILLYRQ
jgi:hypothetical protein